MVFLIFSNQIIKTISKILNYHCCRLLLSKYVFLTQKRKFYVSIWQQHKVRHICTRSAMPTFWKQPHFLSRKDLGWKSSHFEKGNNSFVGSTTFSLRTNIPLLLSFSTHTFKNSNNYLTNVRIKNDKFSHYLDHFT